MTLFVDTETDKLKAIIADGARAWAADELAWVREYVEKHTPEGYVEHQRGVRARYEGRGSEYVELSIKKRFPKRADVMPTTALNYTRFFAASDAGVYRLAPERAGIDDAGVDLKDEKVKRAISDAFADANLDGKMPEFERRVLAAWTGFVHVRWQPSSVPGRPGRVQLDLYWPCDVGVICHRSDPTNLESALVLMARTAYGAVDGGVEWFTLWVRTSEDDAAGRPKSFSPWRSHLVSSRGEYLIPPDDDRTLYVDNQGRALPLPWCVAQIGEPAGSVFVDEDRDLVAVADALNVSRNAEQFAVDVQSHTPVIYTGSEKKESEIAWGPDDVTKIGAGETMTTLPLDPKLSEMRESRLLAMREVGNVRRNPTGYALNDGGAVASGVAREIENEPHNALLDEYSHTFRLFEQNQLLPTIRDVRDAFSGLPAIGPCKFRMTPRRRPTPEEPEAKQRRLQADVDAGLISPAKMAVEIGHYPTIADAVKKGVSDDLKKKAPPPPMFGFGAPPAVDPLVDAPADPSASTTETTPADQVKP